MLHNDNTALVKQLNMLANFAFYAGVGQKTTMGMGQARRLPLRKDQGGMASGWTADETSTRERE